MADRRQNPSPPPEGEIRAAHLLDLTGIETLYRESTSETGAPTATGGAADPGPPLRLWQLLTRSLSAILPLLYPGDELYVYDQAGLRGFIQASGRTTGRRRSWQVVNLCLSPEADPEVVGVELIRHLCNQAIERGVQSLTVRVAVDEPLRPILRKEGFVDYATEHILVGQPDESEPAAEEPFRPARTADVAGLFSLYMRTTPAAVAMVEGNTLKSWRATHSELLSGLARTSGGVRNLVIERGDLDGWARIEEGSATRPNELRLKAVQEPRDTAQALVDAALQQMAELFPGTAWCPVRHYDTEIIAALRSRGFETLGSQVLMVRHLPQAVRRAARETEKQKGLAPAFG